jgi:anaerobic ribonucleoside-triphosphate reductase activating protein
MKLFVHAIIDESYVNGPGCRLTIWTQGCTKACKGCFNPETWKFSGGTAWEPGELADYIRSRAPYGLTLTGGDPLEQPEAIYELLVALHDPDGALAILPGGIICFTGYTLVEVNQIEAARKCLEGIDLLIDGRYIEDDKQTDALAGSANQQFHFLNKPGRGRARIAEDEIKTDQSVEVHSFVDNPQLMQITGFPTIARQWLAAHGLRVVEQGNSLPDPQ